MAGTTEQTKIMPLGRARASVLVGASYHRDRGTGVVLICNDLPYEVQRVTIHAEIGDGPAVLQRETFTVGPIRRKGFVKRPFPLKKSFVCGVPIIDAQVMEVRLV